MARDKRVQRVITLEEIDAIPHEVVDELTQDDLLWNLASDLAYQKIIYLLECFMLKKHFEVDFADG